MSVESAGVSLWQDQAPTLYCSCKCPGISPFDLLTMIQLRFVPGAVTVAATGTQVRFIGDLDGTKRSGGELSRC